MTTNEQILARMRSQKTLLCVGLDPDLRKLPSELLSKSITNEEKILEFLRGVVDVTGPHVCVYKAQKAFFDLLPGGHDVLKEIVYYIHQTQVDVPVIVDCKIGDIDNTMAVYIENLFSLIQADGVVVNPYMGDDVIVPLIDHVDKAIVVLVKTSNISGSIIQDVKISDGRLFWEYLLEMVVNRWNKNGNMIPVLSSTIELDIARLRLLIPDAMPILFAGVGAQGGSYKNLSGLLNSEDIGVFVNSSRGILYPESSQSWRKAIEVAAIEMKNVLNEARGIS
jgi:orotidine-5'-phosphate decarboxylase